MTRIAKAKRCPFCSLADSFVECMDFGAFAVVCNGCGAKGPTADGDGCDADAERNQGRKGAIRAWNRRTRRTSGDGAGHGTASTSDQGCSSREAPK